MKFQPRSRLDAALEIPGGFWRSLEALEAPGGPWRPLEAPGNPFTHEAEYPLQTLLDTMAYNIYYVLFMGFAFWVHLIGICGGL